MTGVLKPVETYLLGERVRLLQPQDGFRTAIDTVLLAAAIPAKTGERILDLGAGVGAAALCVAARVGGARLAGLEIQHDLVDLAGTNAVLNGCADRVTFVSGDVLNLPDEIAENGFDHVMANPPYQTSDSGNPPPLVTKALANVEGAAKLPDWVAAAARAVKPKGSITFIHRADRLDDVVAAFHGVLGGIVVFPLWPAEGKDAKRVIVSARKGVASPARIASGLVLHQADGTYTAAADKVLSGAESIILR